MVQKRTYQNKKNERRKNNKELDKLLNKKEWNEVKTVMVTGEFPKKLATKIATKK